MVEFYLPSFKSICLATPYCSKQEGVTKRFSKEGPQRDSRILNCNGIRKRRAVDDDDHTVRYYGGFLSCL